jgi:hypothetical protein
LPAAALRYTAEVTFGAWHPFDVEAGSAAGAAPDVPGVLQARAQALRAYPRGKSAMVLYAASDPGESLRAFVSGRGVPRLRQGAAAGACWIRFAAAADPARALAGLLGRFADRFGSLPAANEVEDAPHG